MGFREYARHRAAVGLVGGTLSGVQHAVKAGRIDVLVVDGRKLIDQAKADEAWGERTHPDHAARQAEAAQERRALRGASPAAGAAAAPGKASPPAWAPGGADAAGDGELDPDAVPEITEANMQSLSYADARAVRERYAALNARLEYEQTIGQLVPAEQAAAAMEKLVQISRTKVLGLPSKIRTRLPKLSAADVAVVEQLVRDALEELAGQAGDTGEAAA